mmetsp:Transcript_5172/g.9529  ORF Transcript_5172/g.9529 Transcript_5172/m.9529 type:complete len:167 (+) Transcript_5172:393-893(+)|eukprot:CAMPEP_0204902014 /NCGR_PEP_ID=MMETSP1397-20131031/3418_1 /ASSEMBLY_ACC=CAM_ASM_000891 /TAXON_ID=49980 /ORGANISM="Climacostomum Climacostomum virens, Strain Stock W-24" /LENGTH=166 /DNA_ID=CAMNT_0052070455 /DNA_START=388 /DNA_END=888 /DNA_ORIENTATION=+
MKYKNYMCYYEDCRKVFCTKFNLRRHVNSAHLNIRAFCCRHCDDTFSSKQNLIEHEFIHDDLKPYVCSVAGCGLRFRQASQFSVHKRSHSSKKGKKKSHSSTENCIKQYLDSINQSIIQKTFTPDEAAVALPKVELERQSEDAKLPIMPQLLNSQRVVPKKKRKQS